MFKQNRVTVFLYYSSYYSPILIFKYWVCQWGGVVFLLLYIMFVYHDSPNLLHKIYYVMKNEFGYEKLGIAKVKYIINIFIVYGVCEIL